MSYFPTHVIRDLRHPAIRCEEKAIFFAMADRQQSPGDLITASLGTIADDAGVSRKTAQRVMSWASSVGIVSNHVRDGFRCYGFHLDKLVSLPTSCVRDKLRTGPAVPSSGPAVPTMGPAVQVVDAVTMGPADQPMGPADQVQCPAVHCSVSGGPPKDQGRGKQGPNEGASSARDAARARWLPGLLFEPESGPVVPPTTATNLATPTAGPEPIGTSVEPSSVPSADPPVKGNLVTKPESVRKPTKSRAKELSPEQAKAFRDTTDCFVAEFKKVKHEAPILNYAGRDRRVIIEFLEKLNWNSDKAGEIIRNAFSQAYYRERFANFDELLKNTTRYQGSFGQTVPASSGQVFANPDRWGPTMEEIGS